MTPTHRRRRLVFLFFFIVIIRNCISTGFSSHYLLLIQTRNTDDWVFTNFIHFFSTLYTFFITSNIYIFLHHQLYTFSVSTPHKQPQSLYIINQCHCHDPPPWRKARLLSQIGRLPSQRGLLLSLSDPIDTFALR